MTQFKLIYPSINLEDLEFKKYSQYLIKYNNHWYIGYILKYKNGWLFKLEQGILFSFETLVGSYCSKLYEICESI